MTTRVDDDVVSDNCFISKLPPQILHDICLRIPIKDVVQCKSVCSQWNNLLSKPRFSDEYAKYSPFTSILHCAARSTNRPFPRVLDLLEFTENGGDCIRSRIMLKLPQRLERSPLSFVGSCNGLLCIKLYLDGSRVIYVANPILGCGIELPRDYTLPKDRLAAQFRFGFCSTMNKFKVVKISHESNGDYRTGECEVLTVGVDDEWRRLPNYCPNFPTDSDFVALDGIFHWIRKDRGPDFIRTFDLGEENFGQISVPPSLLQVSKPVHMAVSRKQLCLVDSSVQSQISIWTLEKNPGGESWTKIVIFNRWLTSDVYTPYLIPDAVIQSGDMLFQNGRHNLVSYNVEQKKCSEIEFKTVGGSPSTYLLGYTPGFSLPADIIMQKEPGPLFHADVNMRKRRRATANI